MHLVMRRFHSGERVPMLVDEKGMPLCWPTLFATVLLRNAGLAFNSIKNQLNELRSLLRWEQLQGRDLESEFREGKLLSVADVVSIRDFAAKRLDRGKATRSSSDRVLRFLEADLAPGTNPARVSKAVEYNRLTTIAAYVEFVAQTVTARRGDRELAAAVDRMATRLRRHRPRGTRSKQNDDPHRMSPPAAVVDDFIAVGSEGHPENPFRNATIQRRNELIFRLLCETGIRLGELLSLRLDNIQTGDEPTITVRRTHDDRHDPRAYQPVSKTKERTLPITDDLAMKLYDYSMNDRATTPGANRHPYLFVTHRKGKTCGQPLSVSSVSNKVFASMRGVRREFAIIHAHSFRHYKSYVFSKAVDAHNRKARSGEDPTIEPISDGRELRMRAHLNGHRSLKSGEPYNQRHVREATDRAVLDTQQRQCDRGTQSRTDDDA